jgi:hypothetical protein
MSSAFLFVAAMTFLGLMTLGWLASPSSPELDGERLFKTILITLLRGEAESSGASVGEWEARVLGAVPYHPAGRSPESKLSNPSVHSIAAPALDGEQGLVEALMQCEDYGERLARMYDTDEGGLEARLSDPAELGESYDPACSLAPAATWEAVSAWGGGDAAVQRWCGIHSEVTWVLVAGRREGVPMPSILGALADQLDGKALRLDVEHGDLEAAAAAILTAATEAHSGPAHRIIFVGEEAGVALILRAMVSSAPLRDRVLAVVSLGGAQGGLVTEEGDLGPEATADWMAAWFTHRSLDTEIVRMTPYFSIQWLEREAWPPGINGLPLASSRFPVPEADSSVPPAVQSVDLGPLWASSSAPVEQIARALQVFLACWLARGD